MHLHDTFATELDPRWQVTEQGLGQVAVEDGLLHLQHPAHDASAYHNAQISDYGASRQFSLRPPLRLTVTAHASTSDLCGTAGFGFWNHPFAPGESRLDVPQAVWFFFASSESDMALARGVPGHGWKASTFNARRAAFWGLLPTAPLAIPLMNVPALYDALWPIGQSAIGVNEARLDTDLLQTPHTYQLDWHPDRAVFRVDGRIVLDARDGITSNALGFVAWLDNQYAIVSPRGRFGSGFVAVPHDQSLFLHEIRVEAL